MEISEDVKRAYEFAREHYRGPMIRDVLADFARDALAAEMEQAFIVKHLRRKLRLDDERHAWTPEQWQAAADKLLRGE